MIHFRFTNTMVVKSVFRKMVFLLILITPVFYGNAQVPVTKSQPKKGQLTIKPNSRDLKVVLRNNSLQRIDRQRKMVVQKKMQQVRQQKMLKKNVDQKRRQEVIQRRKQMMQQRNAIRR